jgi:hypothetical protein
VVCGFEMVSDGHSRHAFLAPGAAVARAAEGPSRIDAKFVVTMSRCARRSGRESRLGAGPSGIGAPEAGTSQVALEWTRTSLLSRPRRLSFCTSRS